MSSELYSPLGTNQTRFLSIQPSLSSSDSIHCKLEIVSLETSSIEEYEALSYTWGDEIASREIALNERSFKVRENLYQALVHLRDGSQPRKIWIDALCINQEDPDERSAQVLHMSRIYSGVRRVVIWLGVETPGFEGLASQLGSLSEVDRGELFNYHNLDGIQKMFERPWWARSWVIQEYVCAKDRVLMCGGITWTQDILKSFIELIKVFQFEFKSVHADLYWTIGLRGTHRLRELILLCGHCLATDPRDKIYAFLGISIDTLALNIIPDYALSAGKVYQDVVKAYFRVEGNMELICTTYRGSQPSEFPSWVPDWSINRPISQIWIVNEFGHSMYAAGYPLNETPGSTSKDTAIPVFEYISFGAEESLHLYGALVGPISEIGLAVEPEVVGEGGWTELMNIWRANDVIKGMDVSHPDWESSEVAFYRTIVADSPNGLFPMRIQSDQLADYALERHMKRVQDWNLTGSPNTQLKSALEKTSYHSRFAILSAELFAMVPKTAEIGDLVYVLRGFSTPMALRRNEPVEVEEQLAGAVTYRMIGPCFVLGVMDGEMYEQATEAITIL